MSIFLSYRRATQKEFAHRLRTLLQNELQKLGMLSWKDVFLDERSIDLGENYENRLRDEIITCDLFVPIIDSSYFGDRFEHEKDVIRLELQQAFQARRTIVPVVLDLPWPLNQSLPKWADNFFKFQAITGITDETLIAKRLANEFQRHRPLNNRQLNHEVVSLAIVYLTDTNVGTIEPVVVSVGEEGTLCWTKLADGEDYLPPIPLNLSGRDVTALAVSGQGTDIRVVLGLTDSSIAVCDLNNGVMVDAPRLEMMWSYNPNYGPLVSNGAYCTSVVYVPHRAERRLVYANTAGQINIWSESTTGLPVWALAAIRWRNKDMLVVSRREYLKTWGIGDFIEIRDLDSGDIIAQVEAYASLLITVLTDKGVRIVSANGEGTLQTWDENLTLLKTTISGKTGISALNAFGNNVIAGYVDGTVQPWDIDELTPIGLARQEHSKAVTTIAVATIRNRRIIVSGSTDGSVRSYMLEGLLHTIAS